MSGFLRHYPTPTITIILDTTKLGLVQNTGGNNLTRFSIKNNTVLILSIAALLICALIVPSAVFAEEPDNDPTLITIWGSTTVYPITTQAKPGWEPMDQRAGGSSYGVDELLANHCDIGMSSSKKSNAELVEWPVAHDMIGVAVCSACYAELDTANGGTSNDVNVTTDNLKALYTSGTGVTNWTWGQLVDNVNPSSDIYSKKVIPLSRVTVSGTRSTFLKLIGNASTSAEETTQNTVEGKWGFPRQEENGTVQGNINSDTGTHIYDDTTPTESYVIGYLGMAFVNDPAAGANVEALMVNGVEFDPANFSTVPGTGYPLSRLIYYYTLKAQYDGGAAWDMRALDFVEYVLSPDGQDDVIDAGYLKLGSRDEAPAAWWDFVHTPGDLKRMDTYDLSYFGAHWNETGSFGWCAADLNNNGRVDTYDLGMVGNKWNKSWNYTY
jgi:ABC-type phosphate transport system substrate-binding protein